MQTGKEVRKIAARARKAAEKAAAAKAAALRDDDNVFDVSYENQVRLGCISTWWSGLKWQQGPEWRVSSVTRGHHMPSRALD